MKLLVLLIGPLKEKSPLSRTKVAADHAGLSLLQVSLNLSSSSRDKASAFQSNNLWIAPELKEIKAATEDGLTAPSPMPPVKDGLLPLNIPMSQRIRLARRMEVPSESQAKRASQDAVDLAVELTLNPSQLPLMPPTGLLTNLECSATAVHPSTMPSS